MIATPDGVWHRDSHYWRKSIGGVHIQILIRDLLEEFYKIFGEEIGGHGSESWATEKPQTASNRKPREATGTQPKARQQGSHRREATGSHGNGAESWATSINSSTLGEDS